MALQASARGACNAAFNSAIQGVESTRRRILEKNQKSAGRWTWLSEHGVGLLILGGIAFLAFVFAQSRTRTDERLDAIEDTVQFERPPAYEPPDLGAHAAVGVSAESLQAHRAAYVPVYSHIYHDGGRPYLLETTLSIRNVDIDEPIYLSVVDYYDTQGNLSKKYLDRLIRLQPLQTVSFLVQRRDVTGGAGANFIVEWHGERDTTSAPLIEAVMVGRSGTNAIAFVRRSEPLSDWKPD